MLREALGNLPTPWFAARYEGSSLLILFESSALTSVGCRRDRFLLDVFLVSR